MEPIQIIVSSTVIATLLGAVLNNLFLIYKTFQENKYKDSKDNLPILLEILENLNILEHAFIFKGTFCPYIEHRCPEISEKDGDGIKTMSYAQRAHQFRKVGQSIIKNCSKIIFLTPKGYLPRTKVTCKEIKDFLTYKKSSHEIIKIDYLTQMLLPILSGQILDCADFRPFHERLNVLRNQLEQSIESELPSLVHQNNKIIIGITLVTIVAVVLFAFSILKLQLNPK